MPPFRVPQDHHLSARFLTGRADSAGAEPKGYPGKHLSPFLARNAIFHGLAFLKVSRGDRVLVPAYICTAAVEPILAYGAHVDFYRVGRDCRLDLEDIESRITPSTKALLAVHYFGFPQEISLAQALCRQRGISLIEDCAHVLEGHSGGKPLGLFGDVSVFSWRKFLPVYDGADLMLNYGETEFTIPWQSEKLLFTLKVAKNLVEDALGWSTGRMLSPLTHVVRAIMAIGNRRAMISSPVASSLGITPNTDSFDPLLIHWPMSRLSRWIKTHSNVPAIVQARRINYQYLQTRLAKIPGVHLLHPQLPDGVCPWVLPVTFDGMTDAHLALRRAGVPAVTWGGVRPAVLASEHFPDAHFLYDNLVFLPVHQSLARTDLDTIVDTVAAVRKKNSLGKLQRASIPQVERSRVTGRGFTI